MKEKFSWWFLRTSYTVLTAVLSLILAFQVTPRSGLYVVLTIAIGVAVMGMPFMDTPKMRIALHKCGWILALLGGLIISGDRLLTSGYWMAYSVIAWLMVASQLLVMIDNWADKSTRSVPSTRL